MFLAARRFPFIALTAVLLLSSSVGGAKAQTPSNSCARERTECLRARVQKGILGSEYVPPDDAARCNAAYQACLSGQQNAQPAPQPPAAHTTGNVLAGVRKFELGDIWEINGGIATNRKETLGPGADSVVETSRGTVSINRIEGTMTRLYTVSGVRCGSVVREVIPFSFVFSAETVAGELRAGSVEIQSDTCKRGWAKTTEPRSFKGPWRKIE
jgi:hypothetical protein